MRSMGFGAGGWWTAWLGLAILPVAAGASLDRGDDPGPFPSRAIGFELSLVTQGGRTTARLGKALERRPINPALQPGDLILKVDGRPVETLAGLEDHHGPTAVEWFESGTGENHKAVWIFPPLEVRPVLSQPALAKLIAAELEAGKIGFRRPEIQEQGKTFRIFLGQADLGEGASPAWVEQARVALIRTWLAKGADREFWERFLVPVEKAIADELKREAAAEEDPVAFEARVRALYKRATEAYAERTGKRPDPPPNALPPDRRADQPRGPSEVATAEIHRGGVVLFTRDHRDLVYAMPRTKYLIRSLDERKRPIQLVEFNAYEPGKRYGLLGLYVYKLRHAGGSESVLASFEARGDETIRLD